MAAAKHPRFKGITKDAEKLGVSPVHLWLCLTGRRVSKRLMRRYHELKGIPSSFAEKVEISSPAGSQFRFFNTPAALSFEVMLKGKCTREDCIVTLIANAEIIIQRIGQRGVELTIKPESPQ